jgi:uncharacterized protein
MRTIRIALIAALVLAAAAITGIGRPEAAGGAEADSPRGITVTGTGRAELVPNEARFSLGVSTDGETAREALAANSVAMRRVLAALDGAGIPDRDVKTETVSVGPEYDGDGKSPDGFTARNSVSVRIDLDRAGDVLDAGSRAGANEVHGPMLTSTDRDAAEKKALEDAVADARSRAETLAEAAGVRVGRVTAIVEGFSRGIEAVTGLRTAADAASAPIEPGTEEVQATVTVTFAIEEKLREYAFRFGKRVLPSGA